MTIHRTLALCVLAFAGTAALADEIVIATDRDAVSTRTRAEVSAEARQVNQTGVIVFAGTEIWRSPMAAVMSGLKRADVVMQLTGLRPMSDDSFAEGR